MTRVFCLLKPFYDIIYQFKKSRFGSRIHSYEPVTTAARKSAETMDRDESITAVSGLEISQCQAATLEVVTESMPQQPKIHMPSPAKSHSDLEISTPQPDIATPVQQPSAETSSTSKVSCCVTYFLIYL